MHDPLTPPIVAVLLRRARQHRLVILLLILAALLGLVVGLNLVTPEQVIEKVADKAFELAIGAVLLAGGVRQ